MLAKFLSWCASRFSNEPFGFWLVVGFTGLIVFSSRWIVQWIAAERAKRSVIPIHFWFLSIVGTVLLSAYFLHRQDPVGILGYVVNLAIYLRNLVLIYQRRAQGEGTAVESK